jgi:uncharacterized repeat protein (TIGR01451 family)
MTRIHWHVPVCIAGFVASASPSFSDEPFSVLRSFDQRVAVTNSGIFVTATLTNNGGGDLRGFYFTDQLPLPFTVETLSVSIGGQNITNFAVETGREGDVFPGYVPWRWRLETPTAMMESNPVPIQVGAQIVYRISSSSSGTFALQPFDWAAYCVEPTNTVFGFAQTAYEGTVKFVDSTNLSLISVQNSTNGPGVWLDGAPCTPYVLSGSSNLLDWLPLTTNTSPFWFVEDNGFLLPQQFYRAAPLESR